MTRNERLVRKELRLSAKLLSRVTARIERNGFTSFNEYVRFCLLKDLDGKEETEK